MSNNKVRNHPYLNQYSQCWLVFEMLFFAPTPKILFRQYRSKTDVTPRDYDVSFYPQKRTYRMPPIPSLSVLIVRLLHSRLSMDGLSTNSSIITIVIQFFQCTFNVLPAFACRV